MSKNEFKDPERIISMLTAIARLEFNYKLDTTDDSSIENVIAVGLNTLSESLETSVVDAARFKKSENRFKAIAQNVPQYFSYVDKNLCYQFVNNTYIKEFKIKRGEIIGKSMESFLGASFFNKIKPFIDRAISGEELKFETVFNSPIKGKMHVNITYVPDIDESEEVVGLFILINDRTAFEIEQREKNIYEQFFNSSIDLLYVANLDGYFIKINNAFENLLGWTNDEIMDRPFIDFVHPDDKEKTREEFNKYISNRHQSIGFENRYLKKNGGWVWIHWNALASSGGEELFAIGRDVTNQKNQEEKLEQINKQV